MENQISKLVVLQTQMNLETQLAETNQERDNIQSELEASNENDDMKYAIAGIKVVTSEQLSLCLVLQETPPGSTKELETQIS
jgi:hypothetical protein